MAEGDKFIGCLEPPVSFETFLKMYGLKDEDGNVSFNIYYNEQANCDNFEPAYDCLIDMSLEEVLRLVTVEDKCGRPALNTVGVVCAGCTEQQIL